MDLCRLSSYSNRTADSGTTSNCMVEPADQVLEISARELIHDLWIGRPHK